MVVLHLIMPCRRDILKSLITSNHCQQDLVMIMVSSFLYTSLLKRLIKLSFDSFITGKSSFSRPSISDKNDQSSNTSISTKIYVDNSICRIIKKYVEIYFMCFVVLIYAPCFHSNSNCKLGRRVIE